MKTHGTQITPWAVVSVVFVAEVTVRDSKEYAATNDVKELVSWTIRGIQSKLCGTKNNLRVFT